MGRKKKKEDDYVIIPEPRFYEPETTDITTLGDSYHRIIYNPPPSPYTITTTGTGDMSKYGHYVIPPHSIDISGWVDTNRTLSLHDYEEIRRKFEKEEIGNVNVVSKASMMKGEHIVVCEDRSDLSTEKILKTLSAVKGKLMLDVAPIHIKTIECNMTPEVRKNIVTASKRLRMYGKKRPIIARFDEYGNRLPDEIELDSFQGVTLKIIDPDEYGDYYLEMRAFEFPSGDYTTYTTTPWEAFGEDIPF